MNILYQQTIQFGICFKNIIFSQQIHIENINFNIVRHVKANNELSQKH